MQVRVALLGLSLAASGCSLMGMFEEEPAHGDQRCTPNAQVTCVTTCGSTGTGTCSADGWGPEPEDCTPPVETCSGTDDDCDGQTDEGFGCIRDAVASCTTTCGSTGNGTCTASCTIPVAASCVPPAEVCNGADDDCDGDTDEENGECAVGATRDCTVCGRTATQECFPDCGGWSPCVLSEECNGCDDDGDTAPDDGFVCPQGATRACEACGDAGLETCADDCGAWGGCVLPLGAAHCWIDGTCYEDGAASPSKDCVVCETSENTTDWAFGEPNVACTPDAFACTTDVCDAFGMCSHPIIEGSCLISGTCYADGVDNPDNECRQCDTSEDAERWTNKGSDAACAADEFDCTTDLCDGEGSCLPELDEGTCLIDGACYADGVGEAGNPCLVCDPAGDRGAWSGAGCWKDPTAGYLWEDSPPSTALAWSDADTYCAGLALAGLTDWRLPTISELRSLVRGCAGTMTGGTCSVTDSCLDFVCRVGLDCGGCSFGGCYWDTAVAGSPCGQYWSSSADPGDSSRVWRIDYVTAEVLLRPKVDTGIYVRCFHPAP